MLKGIVRRFKKQSTPAKNIVQPTIIPRADHSISRNDINRNALKVLYRLHTGGYQAYLVGGCVRDLLLGRHPKDFDIATNAHPDEVRQLFRNCRLIGKRFRLAHIFFGKEIIEVATFRAHQEAAEPDVQAKSHHGMITRDNVYGSIEDDVIRRDFTINGLYYNIADFSVVDYLDGMKDVRARTLRMIGDPEARYTEDPVRLLRAIRFMGKLNLNITHETEEPIIRLRHLLQKVSSARLFLEVMKLFQEDAMLPTFRLLRKYQLFAELFPASYIFLETPAAHQLIENALGEADKRVKENKTISPVFIFSVLLWPLITHNFDKLKDSKYPPYVAYEKAILQATKDLVERLAIPRNLLTVIREICMLQFRFTQRFGNRPFRLITHARFRAAFDLLQLRATSGEPIEELSKWWSNFGNANDQVRASMIKECEKAGGFTKKKRKKKVIKEIKP